MRRIVLLVTVALMMAAMMALSGVALAQAQGGGGGGPGFGGGGSDAGFGGGHITHFEGDCGGIGPCEVNVGGGTGGSTVSGKGGGGTGGCTTFFGVTQCGGEGGGFSL